MMIGLALILALLAQSPSPPPAGPVMARQGPRAPDKVTGDHAALPMTFTAGLPTIAVTIDGKGPFKVGVDTGAMGGVHMTDRLAAALNLAPVGEAQAVDPSGRNPVAIKLYR